MLGFVTNAILALVSAIRIQVTVSHNGWRLSLNPYAISLRNREAVQTQKPIARSGIGWRVQLTCQFGRLAHSE